MQNNNEKFATTNTLSKSVIANQESIENYSTDNFIVKQNNKKANQKPEATFIIYQSNGKQKILFLIGQEARTLVALVKAGNLGCTALEICNWCYALSSYIAKLRNREMLNISTTMEAHKGGHHARYHILDKVKIIETFNL